MSRGYVYVLTNDAMPGIVKVGKTTNDPSVRVGQLSSPTGVPAKFSLRRQYEVADCDSAEGFAHRVLETVFGRPNAQREFFSGAVEEVIAVLDEALSPYLLKADAFSPEDFIAPIGRVLRKEFTPARMELEELFRRIQLTQDKIALSDTLATAAGAYLACCYATGQPPYHPAILGIKVKGKVMEKAIQFAAEFESDPVGELIGFVRRVEQGEGGRACPNCKASVRDTPICPQCNAWIGVD